MAEKGTVVAIEDNGRRSGLIDQVIETLRARIVDRTWPLGSRIPPEPELAELTGVGRNTVREAVQALVHAGLLERRQGSGTYVTAESEMAAAFGRQLAGARQLDVLEVRQTLEAATASLAAQRRTEEDIQAIMSIRDSRAEAAKRSDLDKMVEHDLQLHRAIARAAHNPVLQELYDDLLDALADNIRFNFIHLAHDDDNHADLLKAIIEGDPDEAGVQVRSYFKAMMLAIN